MSLHLQVCQNHSEREAVARCPVCRLYFCRECVTEHDDQVVCAACLTKSVRQEPLQQGRYPFVPRSAAFLAGLFIAGASFYSFGRLLLLVPTSFHDGSAWHSLSPP